MRIFFAIVAASLLSAASAVVYQFAAEGYLYGALVIAYVAFIAFCIGLLFTLAWGLPFHFALQRLGRKSVVWYAAAGALAGAIFPVFGPEWARPEQLASGLGYYAFTGMLSATVFWIVGVTGVAGGGRMPDTPPEGTLGPRAP